MQKYHKYIKSIFLILIVTITIISIKTNGSLAILDIVPEDTIYSTGSISKLVMNKLSIGGLSLGMKQDKVIKKLGHPKYISKTRQGSGCAEPGLNAEWKYDGMTLEFSTRSDDINKSSLDYIITENSRYSTKEGIKVGDSLKKLEKTYSKFIGYKSSKFIGLNTDRLVEACEFIFSYGKEKKITSIYAGCLAC